MRGRISFLRLHALGRLAHQPIGETQKILSGIDVLLACYVGLDIAVGAVLEYSRVAHLRPVDDWCRVFFITILAAGINHRDRPATSRVGLKEFFSCIVD